MYKKLFVVSKMNHEYVNQAASRICDNVFNDCKALDALSLYFKNNLIVNKSIYMGSGIKTTAPLSIDETIPIKFNMPHYMHDGLDALAHALDLPLDQTLPLLLQVCFDVIVKEQYSLTM